MKTKNVLLIAVVCSILCSLIGCGWPPRYQWIERHNVAQDQNP